MLEMPWLGAGGMSTGTCTRPTTGTDRQTAGPRLLPLLDQMTDRAHAAPSPEVAPDAGNPFGALAHSGSGPGRASRPLPAPQDCRDTAPAVSAPGFLTLCWVAVQTHLLCALGHYPHRVDTTATSSRVMDSSRSQQQRFCWPCQQTRQAPLWLSPCLYFICLW